MEDKPVKMYSGRVFVGFWYDKLQFESEKRAKFAEQKEKGMLPYQRKQRLLRAFTLPTLLRSPVEQPLRFGQRIQLQAVEVEDLTYKFEGRYGCPDEVDPPDLKPRYGLVLAATVNYWDFMEGRDRIVEGCALALSPEHEPQARNVFVIRSTCMAMPRTDGYLPLDEEFVLQLANAKEALYLRSETPLVDGFYGPKQHNPVCLSATRDCYAKWRVVHWNRHKRFETKGSPILPCMRVVIQHVMTGLCLAAEGVIWHHSLLGYECSVSVHTYSDVHRNETSECIWNFLVDGGDEQQAIINDVKTIGVYSNTCNA